MSDIKVFPNSDGSFDVNLLNGDLESDEGLQTAVLLSLFSDRRVTDEELPQGAESKQGWWGDLFPDEPGDQIGSKLWTLVRRKKTLETLRLTEDYAKDALQWMIDDGIAASVAVAAEYQGILSEGRWALLVQITKPAGRDFKYSVQWNAESLRGQYGV